MSDNENKRAALYRRVLPTTVDGSPIVIEDLPDVRERLGHFGLALPKAAVLPRNFDVAERPEDWVFEAVTPELRTIGRQAGLDVSTFAELRPNQIHENDALSIGATILLTAEIVNNTATLIEFFNLVASFLRRRARAYESEIEITQQVIVAGDGFSKRFTYRGPASQISQIVPLMREVMRSSSAGVLRADKPHEKLGD